VLKIAFLLGLALLGIGGLLLLTNRYLMKLGRREVGRRSRKRKKPRTHVIDLRRRSDHAALPRYVDADIGDTLRIIRADGTSFDLAVNSVRIERRSYACPRTGVSLETSGRQFVAQCGMLAPDRGGISPVLIEGVSVSVEVTKLLYSSARKGSSPFNSYSRMRLRGDVRLALWAEPGALGGATTSFVLDSRRWSRDRLANWLHSTSYGIHSAIDIYAADESVPDRVLSPVRGVVYRVYNRDAEPGDAKRNKVINIFGDEPVGPAGERVLYRFHHLSEIRVSGGDPVEPGQVIGIMGNTGFDPRIGAHLHLEMRLNPSCFGQPFDDDIFATIPVNPYPYLLEWQARDRKNREGRGAR
jgi:hypothetical protein